jgi:hypothetical protein
MATSYRGRSSSSRSSWTRQSGSGYGTWGRSASYSDSSSPTRSRGRKSPQQSANYSSSQYRTVSNAFAKKIDGYKMLYAQTQGGGKFGRPSPSTLNSFANWIGKGAVIQLVSPTQVARWARAQGRRFSTQNPSTAMCKTVLCRKFSKTLIKAVCLTKNGQFLVATSQTWNGRAFSFPR